MSFVCPSCGYRDDLRWRNRFWDPHAQIMNKDDFRELYPALFEKLWKSREIAIEGPYAYKLVQDPKKRRITHIVRLVIEDYKARGSFGKVRGLGEGRRNRVAKRFWQGETKSHPREKMETWVR